MSKNILILNGSPRSKGNTATLIESFTKGAESVGHEVTTMELQKMNIHACLGCCKGGADPKSPCVQKDDMDEIYCQYRKADVIVLASPLYFWNISGQLKIAMDRLFALVEGNADPSSFRKESALLMAAQSNEYEETAYWYDGIVKHLGWQDKGQILCGGVYEVGDIAGNAKLDDAFKLGSEI